MDENKVIEELLDHRHQLEEIKRTMMTHDHFDKIMTALDNQGVILQRLDQERLFTIERIKRVEEDVGQIKLQLKIA